MTKYTVIASVSALALLSTAALAQSPVGGPAGPDGGAQAGTPAQAGKARSGYEIPGCENYEIVGSATRQICKINDTRDPSFWRNRDRFNAGAPSGSN